MFAVIYRSYIKPGREEVYQKLWHKIATYFVEHRGAIGSCLHKAEDGMFVAYSRWPNKVTRDTSWPGEGAPSSVLPKDIQETILSIKECGDEDRKLPEICLEVIEDLFLNGDLAKIKN